MARRVLAKAIGHQLNQSLRMQEGRCRCGGREAEGRDDLAVVRLSLYQH
jgi:hypothetical protein